MLKGVQGVHHISIRAENEAVFEELLAFYRDFLGFAPVRGWGEGARRGAVLDMGNTLLELWACGGNGPQAGPVAHFALKVENVDECAERLRAAGRPIIMEPTQVPLLPDYTVRVAFCTGPAGEQIELFQEL